MKYVKPEYENENVNADVITSSYFITPDEKNEQGEPTKITGHNGKNSKWFKRWYGLHYNLICVKML